MIAELWESFPRLLEQNINGLLDEAEPNAMKAFHLYKRCQHEDLWDQSFEEFARRLESYYARPRLQRRKSDLDAFLLKPVPRHVHDEFRIDFRNGVVNSRSLSSLVSWAHNLLRVGAKTDSVVISLDVLGRTLHAVTNPGLHDKAENIEFADFCAAWKKTVFRLFGKKHDSEFNALLSELDRLHRQLKESDDKARERSVHPTIYLTQTEIDWTLAVRGAASNDEPAPKFPLSRGPQKQRLIELERAALLYNLVHSSRYPEFIRHRENIRVTILERCDGLLRDRAS